MASAALLLPLVITSCFGTCLAAQERPSVEVRSAFKFFQDKCMFEQSRDGLRDMYRYLVDSREWMELEAGVFQNQEVALEFSILLTGRATADCLVAFQPAEGVSHAEGWFETWGPIWNEISDKSSSERLDENSYRIKTGASVWDVTGTFNREIGVAFIHSRLMN